MRGVAAMGGDDLRRFDKMEDRIVKFKNHQHLGGKKPYYNEECQDASLLDKEAPGRQLLHIFGRNVNGYDSTLARERAKDCTSHRTLEKTQRKMKQQSSAARTPSLREAAVTPPWALPEAEPDHLTQLSQAWQAQTGLVSLSSSRRPGYAAARIAGQGIGPAIVQANIPGGAPRWQQIAKNEPQCKPPRPRRGWD